MDLSKADDCPAYLTTMLEHQGSSVRIHQKIAERLGAMMCRSIPSWRLKQGGPCGLTDQDTIDAMSENYLDPQANLAPF